MTPVSKLFLAPPALSGCFLAGVYRNTVGTNLGPADRMNHFPASPLAAVTLLRHGALHVLRPQTHWSDLTGAAALSRISVTGPQDKPTTSWAPEGVEALTLGIYPDAWARLDGDPGFEKVAPALRDALNAFAAAPDPDAGWDALCACLSPIWEQRRHATWHQGEGVTDWVKHMIARASMSGSGRSLRSFERRIKRLSGHTRRTLSFFSMIEDLEIVLHENRDASLAEIAHLAGYADQSHMGRSVRRVTGFSPAKLNHAIANEEAFWCYRLLGERF